MFINVAYSPVLSLYFESFIQSRRYQSLSGFVINIHHVSLLLITNFQSQKNPVFNHSTVSLQQHLMSRERSDSDEQFHAAPPGDHRRCSCVPANTPHLSSHNSSVDKQSPHNSRDFLPPPIRLPLNQPEIKVTTRRPPSQCDSSSNYNCTN